MSASGMRAKIMHLWHVFLKEATKFGVVGAIAFVVDMGSWNLLVHGLPGPSQGPFDAHPTWGSVVATLLASFVSWVGNRYWTFHDKRNENVGRELALFIFFNLIALVITAASLYVSRWVFGLDNLVADNLARFIGIALGTLFRFYTYKRYVFTAELGDIDAEVAAEYHEGLPDHGSAADKKSANSAG